MIDLSVIIPTKNRSRRVADLLDSLSMQEKVSFNWEVIVVDNDSSDDTKAITEKKISELGINIRYVLEKKFGLHAGRHRGAWEAKGRFIGLLDDDMILASTWLNGVSLVMDGTADAVVGRILPKWEADPPSWLKEMIVGGEFGYLGILDLGDTVKKVDPQMVFGGNSFLPRAMVFELGGYHPDGVPNDLLRFRGDGESAFMMKFRDRGYTSYYDPSATAYHIIEPSRMTIEYLCKRAYNQGISNSFTEIRNNKGIVNEKIELNNQDHHNNSLLYRIRHKSFKVLFVDGINRIVKLINDVTNQKKNKSKVILEIYKKMEVSYKEGWDFHQNEVKKDPELLKWILKDHYFD